MGTRQRELLLNRGYQQPTLDQENFRVRPPLAAEAAIGPSILVHEGNPMPGGLVVIGNHLAFAAARLSRPWGGTPAVRDADFELAVTRSFIEATVIEEPPQFFRLNERCGR